MNDKELNRLQKENEILRRDVSDRDCRIIELRTNIDILQDKVKELMARIAQIQNSKQ